MQPEVQQLGTELKIQPCAQGLHKAFVCLTGLKMGKVEPGCCHRPCSEENCDKPNSDCHNLSPHKLTNLTLNAQGFCRVLRANTFQNKLYGILKILLTRTPFRALHLKMSLTSSNFNSDK